MPRPKTGRTEKFSLYMTPENLDNLNLLAGAFGTDVTALLNNLIDKYCDEKANALYVLKGQRAKFREMFCKEKMNNG